MTTHSRSRCLHILALFALASVGSLLLASSTALAQTSPAPTAAPDVPPPDPPAAPQTADEGHRWAEAPAEPPSEPKEQGHVGFAAVFSIGYATPSGDATGAPNDSLSSSFGSQVPLSLELGGNVTPSLFIGAYGTFAPGGAGSTLGTTCTTDQLNCSSNSVHGGLAVRLRLLPGELVEPWIGYGVGYESNTVSASSSQSSATASVNVTGWEFGHFSAGVDFLAARMFAFGPFVDVAVGQYSHIHTESPTQTQDADIVTTGLHEWITVGVRTVIMP